MPTGVNNNLIPLTERDPEERRRITSNGGKKCAENKRKRKALREYLEVLLTTKTETGDWVTDMSIALIQKALDGDIKAYEVIRDTLGESPKQQLELSTDDTIEININGKDKA